MKYQCKFVTPFSTQLMRWLEAEVRNVLEFNKSAIIKRGGTYYFKNTDGKYLWAITFKANHVIAQSESILLDLRKDLRIHMKRGVIEIGGREMEKKTCAEYWQVREPAEPGWVWWITGACCGALLLLAAGMLGGWI